MFDIGGWEFLIIVVVAIVIIGPKDLPGMIRSVTGWVRKARELAREFQSGIDDLAQEVELEKIGDEFRDGVGLGEHGDIGNTIHQEVTNAIDPSGEMADALDGAKDILEDDMAKIQEDLDEQDELSDSANDVVELAPTKNAEKPEEDEASDDETLDEKDRAKS